MFGKNQIVKQDLGDGQALRVVSIFSTIQGEGPFAGEPAIFIRLGGCNLRCYFCDTDFETNQYRHSIEDIVTTVKLLQQVTKTDLIVITGGEPLLQNIVPLMKELVPENRVQIETAGTVWVPGLERFFRYSEGTYQMVTLVCSPKTGTVNEHVQRYCNDWKYIIMEGCIDTEDGLPNMSTQLTGKVQKLARPQYAEPRIYLQPCDEHDEVNNKRNIELTVVLAKKFGYRVCLQQHKYMGVE